MSASDKHNRLAHDFVQRAGRETRSSSELLVVVESMILAAYLLLTRLYDLRPDVADGLVEAARQRAFERFVEKDAQR
ncbi:hypothetical protein [Aurantimonas sp. 22II-16-19i]|uniref:hypothetical protein n=1 Tax=Aurantimonas sp. 22II-16-19i TaxID=1317114 RepID=UPI0009F7E310|nr:hypothetical protein [Aurantimonas sp. 22II-16-19i]ORE90973.1 hypothetical protein ATO4_19964 [Aurantimonas sp. 22II-16-19i]